MKNLKSLPQVKGHSKILVALDYYDGPIGGFVEINNDLYHFEWDMDALEEYDTGNSSRLFALRKAPAEIQPNLRTWCQRYDELLAQLNVLNNPHIYPISNWQKSKMPSVDDIEKTLTEHEDTMPAVNELPITAWMEESGAEFAAIQVIYMSKEDSDYYQTWQNDVAIALKAEDQNQLNNLFAKKPESVPQNYIFKVYVTDPNGSSRAVLRDHKGQPLPSDFWMTSKHSIQDLTYLK